MKLLNNKENCEVEVLKLFYSVNVIKYYDYWIVNFLINIINFLIEEEFNKNIKYVINGSKIKFKKGKNLEDFVYLYMYLVI